MYTTELYNRTVDILYQAYFNDTLEHGSTCGCAVGNIIAANLGLKPEIESDTWEGRKTYWYAYLSDIKIYQDNQIRRDIKREAEAEIEVTGYSLQDIVRIEKAFEYADDSNEDAWMFNGLVAVLDVLKEIHGITDDEDVKGKFTSHYKALQRVYV